VEKIITKSFSRLLDKATHRGFVTLDELSKSLGKRNFSRENIEKAFLHVFDLKICLVKQKSEYRVNKKKDSSSGDTTKSADLEKSDDPIRMYLREMGGVELLSREGEIAIAKRIEAGKNVMTTALLQSPLTAAKIFEWKEKLEKNELLVREIIDIDSAYADPDSEGSSDTSSKNKENQKKPAKEKLNKTLKEKKENDDNEKTVEYDADDEFNPSLAAMEEEIRPKIIATIDRLVKKYLKLIKYQIFHELKS